MDIRKIRLQNNYDFLRIFAALCIAFTHSFNLLKQNAHEPLVAFSNGRYDFSFIGLNIFFAISGYLITKSACTSASFKNYVWKRFLRIQPLLIVVTLISIIILGPIFTKLSLSAYFKDYHTWTYLRNVFPATGIQFSLPGVFENNIGENGVNGSLWTLILEERLYLLTGVLLFVGRKGKNIFIGCIALLNLLMLLPANLIGSLNHQYIHSSVYYYYIVFLNAGVFYLIGADFGLLAKPRFLFPILIVSLAILFLPELSVLHAIILPMLILTLARIKGPLNKTGIFGDFTYGIYIFAFPVQQMLIALHNQKLEPWHLFFETIAIIVPLAIISWYALEKKMLSLKDRIT